MAPYELVLGEAAAMALVAAARPEQRRLGAVLDRDLQKRDMHGRVNEIIAVGNWIVTYWADHAVREVRVVRIERVED